MATNVTVKGVEVATNLIGKGALSLATFLVATLKQQKKTKGKARMQAFAGKTTKVFVIKNDDLKTFHSEAKKYGVLYAAVVNKKQKDGLVDVVVQAQDAARVNRIAERFAMPAQDVEKIREDIEKRRRDATQKERTNPAAEKTTHTVDDETLEKLIKNDQPSKVQRHPPIQARQNPTSGRTEKSNLSVPSSDMERTKESTSERPSVRKEIENIRKEREIHGKEPEKARETRHIQPKRKKRIKSKGER